MQDHKMTVSLPNKSLFSSKIGLFWGYGIAK